MVFLILEFSLLIKPGDNNQKIWTKDYDVVCQKMSRNLSYKRERITMRINNEIQFFLRPKLKNTKII